MKSTKKNKIYKAAIRLDTILKEEDAGRLSGVLFEDAVSVSLGREEARLPAAWSAEFVFNRKPDAENLRQSVFHAFSVCGLKAPALSANDFLIEEIPDTDWLTQSYRQFPPITVGPFFIRGSHYKDPLPRDAITLQIDAVTAFGSGEHATTRGCLQAMLDLKERGVCPWNVLDLGTGSGILAIAAWKLWKTPVLAVDMDPEAVRVAGLYRDYNGVPGDDTGITCGVSDGFCSKTLQQKMPFDLILANILAAPLKAMAAELQQACDDNGYAVLSGLLCTQAGEVSEAYEAQGMKLRARLDLGEWSTLTLQKAVA